MAARAAMGRGFPAPVLAPVIPAPRAGVPIIAPVVILPASRPGAYRHGASIPLHGHTLTSDCGFAKYLAPKKLPRQKILHLNAEVRVRRLTQA